MKSKLFLTVGLCFMFLIVNGTSSYGANWILNSNNDNLPADLATKVSEAGGTLVRAIDDMGIAIASFPTRTDAQAMTAHGMSVMPDLKIQWAPVETQMLEGHGIGTDETFYSYQWHLPLIQADDAWDAGATGAGVRVAILDSGIWYGHPDLYYNIDFVTSATFVPGTTDFFDDNGHGTHVAGIVAAADDAFGTIGVAPNATLVGVKVLDSTGAGAFSWIVEGIYHAANSNVDIINMSLGGSIRAFGDEPFYTAQESLELIWTVAKAILYAKSKGCLVICSAGNEADNMDKNGDLIYLPVEAGGTAVSATGPVGLANFDNPASYTNYGKWAIYVAAPGGDYQLYPAAGWELDMVLSTFPGGWGFAAGTSQAAPVVSGVAALVKSIDPGISNWGLKWRLAWTAEDNGSWWKNKYTGWGRVNAYKAITNTH